MKQKVFKFFKAIFISKRRKHQIFINESFMKMLGPNPRLLKQDKCAHFWW